MITSPKENFEQAVADSFITVALIGTLTTNKLEEVDERLTGSVEHLTDELAGLRAEFEEFKEDMRRKLADKQDKDDSYWQSSGSC